MACLHWSQGWLRPLASYSHEVVLSKGTMPLGRDTGTELALTLLVVLRCHSKCDQATPTSRQLFFQKKIPPLLRLQRRSPIPLQKVERQELE